MWTIRLFALVFFLSGCGDSGSAGRQGAAAPSAGHLAVRIDAALGRAARFLVARQAADGAWRSAAYGCFRDGPELTPHILSCLFFLPQGGDGVAGSFRRGADFLAKMVGGDGAIAPGPRGLNFPVFTAASASRVVGLEKTGEERRRAHAAWLAYLRTWQLTEALGWTPDDPEYGGWGFSIELPRKPREGQLRERFFESNLVATVFGIACLRSAKAPPDDPAYGKALAFVKRCQNFAEAPAESEPRFDDGGFFFIPNDALQNKAGVAGKDRSGRLRFHSYGSMTADGLRALVRCGLSLDHPRVVAARAWLETHFTPATNPGIFEPSRAALRDATYFYYCWAVAHAFLALGVQEVQTASGKVKWAEALAEELVRRQEADGSWTNACTDAKEDDPLVATPWAAAALAICRGTITGEHRSLGRPCVPLPRGPEPQRVARPSAQGRGQKEG